MEPSLRTLRKLVLSSPIGCYLQAGECVLLAPSFSQYLNSPEESPKAAEEYLRTIERIPIELQTLPPPPLEVQSLAELEVCMEAINNRKENGLLDLLKNASRYKGDADLCLSLSDSIAAVSASRAAFLRNAIAADKIPSPPWDLETKTGRECKEKMEKLCKENRILHEQANLQLHALSLHLYAQRRYRDILLLEAFRNYWSKIDQRDTELEGDRFRKTYPRLSLDEKFEPDLLTKLPNRSGRLAPGFLPLRQPLTLESLASSFSALMGVIGRAAPSLPALKNLSERAIGEVHDGAGRYAKLMEEGKTGEATSLLIHLWTIGPYQTEIQTIPLEQKQRADRYAGLVEAVSVGLASGALEKLSESLGGLASIDTGFRPEGMLSTIRSLQESSNAAVERARECAKTGDFHASRALIEHAAALWPDNPQMTGFAAEASAVGDSALEQMRGRAEFDRLYLLHDYRSIFEQGKKFAAALASDPSEARTERLQQLSEVVKRCRDIEDALKRSLESANRGEVVLAWEGLTAVSDKYPDDQSLARSQADLASRIPAFFHDVGEARKRDERKDYGAALARYLEIQNGNPSSKTAKEGVEHLVDKIFQQ